MPLLLRVREAAHRKDLLTQQPALLIGPAGLLQRPVHYARVNPRPITKSRFTPSLNTLINTTELLKPHSQVYPSHILSCVTNLNQRIILLLGRLSFSVIIWSIKRRLVHLECLNPGQNQRQRAAVV